MTSQPDNNEGPSFYLLPENENADRVLQEPRNASLLSATDEGDRALLLSFSLLQKDRITLGRQRCDVYIPDTYSAHIHRVQCVFTYSVDTGAVVLQDRSSNSNTQVYDPEAELTIPMSHDLRSVVVARGFNRKIAIGNNRHYRFQLIWHSESIRSFLSLYPLQFGPRWGDYNPDRFRYLKGDELGTGAFGSVYKAANIHDGVAMAVKRYHSLENKRHLYAIREINNVLRLTNNNTRKHDHILSIYDYVYDNINYKWIELFMPLKEGSVKSLVRLEGRLTPDSELANIVLYQMASALCYMADHRIIHRDIKPDNILYDTRIESATGTPYYHFLLADFGLSHEAAFAATMAGTLQFMAPEVSHQERQTAKMDIWSLFATVVWIRNTDHFREFHPPTYTEMYAKLMDISQLPEFSNIKEMAVYSPRDRISAHRLFRRLDKALGMSASISAGAGASTGTGTGTGTGKGTGTFSGAGTETGVPLVHPISGNLAGDFAGLSLGGGGGVASGASGSNWQTTYVAPIADDVASLFAAKNTYNYAPTTYSTMTGESALADMTDTQSVFSTSPSNAGEAYQPGRLNKDYLKYSSVQPRTMSPSAAGQAGGENEDADSDTADSESKPDKGKGYVYYHY